jgi:phage tail-like protein
MADGSRKDPLSQFNFIIKIQGVIRAGFTEVSGLTMDTNIIEYREGNEITTVRKLPGLMKYMPVVCKAGITGDLSLYSWRKTVIDGKTSRVSLSITLLNEARQPTLTWNIREAWPSKYDSGPFNAKTSEAAIETLEITHEGIELASA